MKKLFATLAVMLMIGCSASTFQKTVDYTLTTNKIAWSKVSAHYTQKCVDLAKDCVTMKDKECKPAHECLKQFKYAMHVSVGIDSSIFAAVSSKTLADGDKKAAAFISEAIARLATLVEIAEKLGAK